MELLDHSINERHLKHLLSEYVRYYHLDRTQSSALVSSRKVLSVGRLFNDLAARSKRGSGILF
jgi:hypothetical protein